MVVADGRPVRLLGGHMSGFYVKPEFLKKLQPFICGEGVLSTDAPYCKE